jgi:hypothetical protein
MHLGWAKAHGVFARRRPERHVFKPIAADNPSPRPCSTGNRRTSTGAGLVGEREPGLPIKFNVDQNWPSAGSVRVRLFNGKTGQPHESK